MKADEERLAGLEAEEKRLGTMGPVGEQIAAAESTPNEIPHVPVRESYQYLSPTFDSLIERNNKYHEQKIMNLGWQSPTSDSQIGEDNVPKDYGDGSTFNDSPIMNCPYWNLDREETQIPPSRP